MRRLAQQAFALPQGFAHQVDFAVFQITQTAMNNARRPAGSARGKIVLINDQRVLSTQGTLARNGYAIDAAADNEYIKVLARRGRTLWATHFHLCLDAS